MRIEGARTVPVASAEECLDVLTTAARNLKFAATSMNRHSSRSHSVCRLFVEIHHAGSAAAATGGAAASRGGDSSSADPLASARDHLVSGSSDRIDPTDGGPHDLRAWRRRSVQAISAQIDRSLQTGSARITNATLTLCDLAGSEDVGRSGASVSRLRHGRPAR